MSEKPNFFFKVEPTGRIKNLDTEYKKVATLPILPQIRQKI